ncbi:MAG: tetratricopeptide repeat protein [Bacteroidota bacterium]
MNKPIISCLILIIVGTLAMGQTEKQLYKRGMTKLEGSDFQGAETDFSMVIELNPRNDGAYYHRGFSRMKLGNHPAAIQDYSLALDINPANPEAYYNRGRAKLGLEDYLGAIIDFNISIKGKAKEARYYRARARAKSGLQDYRGAVQDLNLAIKLTKGKSMDLIFDRAEAYINLKFFDRAINDLDRVVKTRPGDPSAYSARATIKLQAGDLDGACLDWSRAGELGDINAYGLIRKHCN